MPPVEFERDNKQDQHHQLAGAADRAKNIFPKNFQVSQPQAKYHAEAHHE